MTTGRINQVSLDRRLSRSIRRPIKIVSSSRRSDSSAKTNQTNRLEFCTTKNQLKKISRISGIHDKIIRNYFIWTRFKHHLVLSLSCELNKGITILNNIQSTTRHNHCFTSIADESTTSKRNSKQSCAIRQTRIWALQVASRRSKYSRTWEPTVRHNIIGAHQGHWLAFDLWLIATCNAYQYRPIQTTFGRILKIRPAIAWWTGQWEQF